MPSSSLAFSRISSMAELRRRVRDEASALRVLENLRWPTGPHCPECGVVKVWRLKADRRGGRYECSACARQFSVTSGTPLHSTKLPISIWIEAMWLVVTSSKGLSSITLGNQIGVSKRTAWKMGHAIRLMMKPAEDEPKLEGVVEVDEMVDGSDPARRKRAIYGQATAKHIYNPPGRGSDRPRILVATERGGRARTAPVDDGKLETVEPVVIDLADVRARLMTDGDRTLGAVGRRFAAHEAVNHSAKEYVRDEAHVNTAEGFNMQVRRAKLGVWHYWSQEHQHRYLHEIQFHWDHRPRFRKVEKKRVRTAEATPALVRLQSLFVIGKARQLRWTKKGSIREVEPLKRRGSPAAADQAPADRS
jgi:transposase-like protein